METGSPRGYTRNRGPLAPRWIPLVLGIDFEGQETHRKNTDTKSMEVKKNSLKYVLYTINIFPKLC